MTRALTRWIVAAALSVSACSISPNLYAAAPAVQSETQQVASVEQLKMEAFKALRGGQFDKTSELLNKAASMSADDRVLAQMAQWTSAFEAQRESFAAERHEQHLKAVAEAHKLLDAGKDSYAIHPTVRAYLLAEDKKAFVQEPWVADLIKSTAKLAADYEASDKWLKALRLYSGLGSIEPANPEWKSKLKVATRRYRLFALYAPDALKKLQESETDERFQVNLLLAPPSTQPTTSPLASTQPSERAFDPFKIDWRETVRGVRMDMLWEALVDSRDNYWRDTNLRELILGGLHSVEVLATTQGLDQTFPGLADQGKREAFLTTIRESVIRAKASDVATEQEVGRQIIKAIQQSNDDNVKIPSEVLVSEFADGAFAELDEYSQMIWPYGVDELTRTTEGSFSGVGIQIQSDDDGSVRVVSPLEDSPALKAGIRAGDIITSIDGKSAKGISLETAVKSITGETGSNVVLTILSPDGVTKDYSIRRETIKVESIKGYIHKPGGGWDFFVDKDNGVGYIRLTTFAKNTTEELEHALAQLKAGGAKAIILDIRDNRGGLLTTATEVSDKFLSGGVIVSTRADRETQHPATVAKANKDDDDELLPMVVLVNQYSASASEIVSGALKDQKRAILVGERTFGKGSVQMLFPLNRRSAFLKLTTSHYYLPSGKCIHREENSLEWGVDPDLTIEMTPEQMRAVIDARQQADVLRDAENPDAPAKVAVVKTPTTAPSKDVLASDPQLSAALLLLRLQVAGGAQM